ncbi:hypothetical protein GALMADRAFT_929879 [Galerina marginata CBS 339.88]|uniref:Uncharacterized protein n=1 Tax=Galerina marginata (strain CBS 339.88) TaxID=685588 RepID=A0A067SRB0_GALM3|nr:hypothetical protein GALMADRAFT_929879 [Galerina marginata CBS 339.88]
MRYAAENLPYLCQMGSFTPALRESLFSFRVFHDTNMWGSTHIISYMNTLRNKENAQDLYSHLLSDFDEYLFSYLKKFVELYPNENRILQRVTLGLRSLGPFNDLKKDHWVDGVFGYYLFSGSRKANETDTLVDFFDDPTRSKEFTRTGETYAAAALAGFNGILFESLPGPTYGYTIPEPIWEDADNNDPELLSIQFFVTSCCYLHQLLDRSSHSPELIAFIQSGKFKRTYGGVVFQPQQLSWSYRLEEDLILKVLQASEAYLKVSRVSPAHLR